MPSPSSSPRSSSPASTAPSRPPTRAAPPAPPPAPPASDLAAGIRFIRRTPLLQASLLGTATFNLFNTAFWALLVLFATREMGLGSGAIGIALGVGAVGSILGTVWAKGLN